MKRATLVLAILALLLGGIGQAKAGPMTYSIDSYLSEQSGWTLSGTITTDGTLGAITATNILSWEITVTNGTSTYSNASGGLLGISPAIVTGTLDATATNLILPIPNNPATEENALQLGNGFFDFALVEWAMGDTGPYPAGDWYHSRVPGTITFWSDNPPIGTLPLPTAGEPFIIAGPVPSQAAVPEPASLTLLGIGTVCSLGYGWRRRRRQSA